MRIVIGAIACFLWLSLVDYVCRNLVPSFIWFCVAVSGLLFIIDKVETL